MAPLIAIVDDEVAVQRALGRVVKSVGLEAVCFSSAEEYLEAHSQRQPNCLILDLRLPGMSGNELQSRLMAGDHKPPIIVVSAHDDPPSRKRALQDGAIAFLGKPFDDEVLLRVIRSALRPSKE